MSFNFLSKTGQFANGLVGTVGYTVYKTDGTEQTVRTTAGIVAIGATGYAAIVTLPSDGAYVIQWDDGSAHYDYDSPPIAILADGVTHGGTPFSSTATYAGQLQVLHNPDGPGMTLGSGSESQPALSLGGGGAGIAISSYRSPAIYILCDNDAALNPAILIDNSTDNGGDGIKIIAKGTGSKAILLAGDAATDALAIAAGAGTPIDIFDDTGAVRTSGGGGGGGPVTLDLTQVVPTTNTPQTVGDALNVTRPVTVDLTQVIPTTNTEQTIGDALNAARSMGFGGLSINKIAKTLTLFAPNGTTPVHVFNLDNVSSPTSRT